MNLPGNDYPVLCNDGHFGMIIRYIKEENTCGIQVYGEDNIRWVNVDELFYMGSGVLFQKDK